MLASCSFFISLALSEMFTDVEAFLEYLKVRVMRRHFTIVNRADYRTVILRF